MSSIRQTVHDTLVANGMGQYQSQATTVVSALEERERVIADRLMEAATSRGLGHGEAAQVLRDAGLTMSTSSNGGGPEEADSSDSDRVARLEQEVRALRALADRHLGRR